MSPGCAAVDNSESGGATPALEHAVRSTIKLEPLGHTDAAASPSLLGASRAGASAGVAAAA